MPEYAGPEATRNGLWLGTDLDHQFAELLKALGVGATEVLRTAGLVGRRSVDANQGRGRQSPY
jgi:hypothetical protein